MFGKIARHRIFVAFLFLHMSEELGVTFEFWNLASEFLSSV